MFTVKRSVFIFLLAAALTVTACSSDDTFDTEQLFGSYAFTEFVFEPDPQLPDTDLLEELESVDLELFRGGEFSLRYRFPGEAGSRNARGTFTTGANDVRLSVNNPDNHRDLFLPESFRLTIEDNGERLLRDIRRTNLNLDATRYDRYTGARDIDGTLVMRLERQ